MPLKISLKPHEKIVIDHAVIVNGDSTSKIRIENHVPVLRERDLIKVEDVTSPCQELYFTIQMMYLDLQNLEKHHETYWTVVKPLLAASPSMLNRIGEISQFVSVGEFYKALKLTKDLIDYESQLINGIKKPQAQSA